MTNHVRTLTAICFALSSGLSLAQTNFSDIVGYTTLNVRGKATSSSPNASSFIALNVHRPAAFKGQVGTKSLSGQQSVITLSSSAFTNNQLTGQKHYLRVTSGANTGLVSEITANSTDTITVADNLDAVLVNNTTQFEVRPFWTLDTAFPSGAGLQGNTSATSADNLTVFDPTTGVANTYFYNSSLSKWRKGFADSGSDIIPPGSGIMITRKVINPVTIRITGEVITSAVLADIPGASSQKQALVANPYPAASLTLANSGLYTGNSATGVVGGTSGSSADTVTIFNPTNGVATSYYYNTSGNQWRTGLTDASNVVIPEGAAVLITRRANRSAFEWYIPSPIANLNP